MGKSRKDQRVVRHQHTREIKDNSLTYWGWMEGHGKRAKFGFSSAEQPQANPDVLPEAEAVGPSTPQLLMGEAIQHLQGRQKEVYLLTMREGRSLAEAAKVLEISKGTAQRYRERAIKFISGYCREAMERGRV